MLKRRFKYFILSWTIILFLIILGLGLGLSAYGLGMQSRNFAYSIKDYIDEILPKGKYTVDTDIISQFALKNKIGINPATGTYYDDPNTVATDLLLDESYSSLDLGPSAFYESGLAWLGEHQAISNLLAPNYQQTDFYLGTGKWDLSQKFQWITHSNFFPYNAKGSQKELKCEEALVKKGTCRVVDGKIQLWQASDYQGIAYWDAVKAQEKSDTFNQYLGEFAIILVHAKVDTNGKLIPKLDDKGHTIKLTAEEKTRLTSTTPVNFYHLNYAKAFYQTRIGTIFLIILTPIIGILGITGVVSIFRCFPNGLNNSTK
ncbi:hypothetical protein [Spiroplasma eriocheiris]|uniref:Uncharacterized protein n=1 Tax=Spiroplasma eriocheiris TaxID=315358 RepID=A0A0H3XMA4_9MOLU|nr:hypothetical protein [Spiroplasma eriocheiris]AHF58294.1 hypothetical protein SPE_1182 [Spiroplasma eriocheiris CCTCC M 207170]AKM54729.1 hypothetical protein SERIO_v1c11800 [Spiroplasma eriocheiris]